MIVSNEILNKLTDRGLTAKQIEPLIKLGLNESNYNAWAWVLDDHIAGLLAKMAD